MTFRIFLWLGLCVIQTWASSSDKRLHDQAPLEGEPPKHRPFKSAPHQLQTQPQEIITDFILPYLALSDKAALIRVSHHFLNLCQHDLVYQDLIKNLKIKDKRPSALETLVAFNLKTESLEIILVLMKRMLHSPRSEIRQMAFTDFIYPLMSQRIRRPSIDWFFRIYEELMVTNIAHGHVLSLATKTCLAGFREQERGLKRLWSPLQINHFQLLERTLGLLKQTDASNISYYQSVLKEHDAKAQTCQAKTVHFAAYYLVKEILAQKQISILYENGTKLARLLKDMIQAPDTPPIYRVTSKVFLAQLRLRGLYYGSTILNEEQLTAKSAVDDWFASLIDPAMTPYVKKEILPAFLSAFFIGDINQKLFSADQVFDLIEWGFSNQLFDVNLSSWCRYHQALMKVDGWLVKNKLSWETVFKFLTHHAQGAYYVQERAHFEIGMLRMNNNLPENVVSWSTALEHFRVVKLVPQYVWRAELYATLIELEHFSQKLSQDKIQKAYVTLKAASTSHTESARKELIQKHMATLFLRLDSTLYPYEGPCILIPPPQK